MSDNIYPHQNLYRGHLAKFMHTMLSWFGFNFMHSENGSKLIKSKWSYITDGVKHGVKHCSTVAAGYAAACFNLGDCKWGLKADHNGVLFLSNIPLLWNSFLVCITSIPSG